MNSLLGPFEDGKAQEMQITNTLKRRHSMYNPRIKEDIVYVQRGTSRKETGSRETVETILARNGSSKNIKPRKASMLHVLDVGSVAHMIRQ